MCFTYFGVVGCIAFKSHQDTMPMLPKTEARLKPTIPKPSTFTIIALKKVGLIKNGFLFPAVFFLFITIPFFQLDLPQMGLLRYLVLLLVGIICTTRSDWLVVGNCNNDNPFANEFEVRNGNCAPMDNTRGSNPTQWLNLFCAPDGKSAMAYECSDPKCRTCVANKYSLKSCDGGYNYFDCFENKPNYTQILGTKNYGLMGLTADNCTSNYMEKVVALDRCIRASGFGLKLECADGKQIFTEYNDDKCLEEISHEIIPLGCSKEQPGTTYSCSNK